MNDAKPYNETKATSTTHGLGVLKRAVKELGARALDNRTSLAKELQAEREELMQALGGESEVSPQERAIIQMMLKSGYVGRLPHNGRCSILRSSLIDVSGVLLLWRYS